MFELKSGNYELEVSQKAAEVHTFKRSDEDYNYVWSGNPEFWAGRNPILFPQVSSNSEKTIKVDGIKYKTGNHGFARNQTFNLIEQKADELTLGIEDSEDTLSQYPFKFALTVNYKLNDNRLDITYTIKNKDTKVMPFGFGLHPAFACSHNYENTKVVFNCEEDDCGSQLTIDKELFDNYPTYVINKPKATKASLISGERTISIEYKDYNIFAIWSKGDFVCLEPWMNHMPSDSEIEYKDIEGTMFLNPNQERQFKYSWLIEK